MSSTLITTLRPVLVELGVLAALAVPAVHGLTRRPPRSARLVTVPPRPWVRIMTWALLVLLLWAAAGRAWLGVTHEEFGLQSSLAAGAVKLGVAVVLWLYYASATLVAGQRGLHWFSFFRPWRQVPAVSRTNIGVRFRIDGRPAAAAVSVLDDSVWLVDATRWRTLRSLVRERRRDASRRTRETARSAASAEGPRDDRRGGTPGREVPGGVPGIRRRPLPTAPHRLGR